MADAAIGHELRMEESLLLAESASPLCSPIIGLFLKAHSMSFGRKHILLPLGMNINTVDLEVTEWRADCHPQCLLWLGPGVLWLYMRSVSNW
jgi:hypothetical protein